MLDMDIHRVLFRATTKHLLLYNIVESRVYWWDIEKEEFWGEIFGAEKENAIYCHYTLPAKRAKEYADKAKAG